MIYTLRFFLFKMQIVSYSNVFGFCIINILYTGCAKIKKNNSGAKRLTKVYWLRAIAVIGLRRETFYTQKYGATILQVRMLAWNVVKINLLYNQLHPGSLSSKVVGCEMYWFGLEQGQVAGCCVNSNEHSGFIKCGKFFYSWGTISFLRRAVVHIVN